MKSKMSQAFMPLRLSVLAAVIVLTSPVTLAQDPGWYSGFGVGKAWTDIDVGEVVTRLHAAGYNSSLISTYDDDVECEILDKLIGLEYSLLHHNTDHCTFFYARINYEKFSIKYKL